MAQEEKLEAVSQGFATAEEAAAEAVRRAADAAKPKQKTVLERLADLEAAVFPK